MQNQFMQPQTGSVAVFIDGLENIESAVEQANIFPAIVQFEAALQQLAAEPVDPSLRAAVLEDARFADIASESGALGLAKSIEAQLAGQLGGEQR